MNEKKTFLEKHVELIKWFISSVVIIIVTIIIDNGFRERSAGIQEMQAFDRYVDIILKADNIEERWKLSEFFSTVTPTDRLRKRWIDYKKLISSDYETFKSLKEQEFVLKQQVLEGKSIDVFNKLKEIKKKLEPYEGKLTDGNTKELEPLLPKISDKPLENKIPKANPQTQDSNPEISLNKFKKALKEENLNDKRYIIDDIFNKAEKTNNETVQKLISELGEPFQNIVTGLGRNYKESLYSYRSGIISKFDNEKTIWPTFEVKVYQSTVLFTLKERESSESMTARIDNINWPGVESFIKAFYIKRLDQLH